MRQGRSVTNQPAEAAFSERWQAEADEPLSDRPGTRILGAPLLGEVPVHHLSRASAGRAAALPPALEPSVADAYHVVEASLDHELAGVGGS
jgi:hypothetical protein